MSPNLSASVRKACEGVGLGGAGLVDDVASAASAVREKLPVRAAVARVEVVCTKSRRAMKSDRREDFIGWLEACKPGQRRQALTIPCIGHGLEDCGIGRKRISWNADEDNPAPECPSHCLPACGYLPTFCRCLLHCFGYGRLFDCV